MQRTVVSAGMAFLAVSILAASGQVATAATYSFYNITNNNSADSTIGSQLRMDVGLLAGKAAFTFSNLIGTPSSITDIYFADTSTNGTLQSIHSQVESAGVDFEVGASPGNLPGGNSITPQFNATTGLTADSDIPVSHKGINSISESLTILVNLKPSISTLASLLAAIQDKTLRIGLHVQSINGSGSESFINNPSPVPLPAGLVLFLTGLVGMGFVNRLKGWRTPRAIAH